MCPGACRAQPHATGRRPQHVVALVVLLWLTMNPPAPPCALLQSLEFSDIRQSSPALGDRTLVVRAYPLMQWLFGVFVLGGACFFTFVVVEGFMGIEWHNHKEGYWWQVPVAVVIFGVAVAIIVTGKIETLHLDRQAQQLVVSKTTVTGCTDERLRRRLYDLQSVTLEHLGRETVTTDNRHFKLGLRFTDGTKFLVLESKDRRLALERLKTIRDFVFGDTASFTPDTDVKLVLAERARMAAHHAELDETGSAAGAGGAAGHIAP